MGKLAVLHEWALSAIEEVLAHLGLELLLQGVELTLIAVEVVVVGLLSQVSEDLAWWVVEVSWSSLGVNSLALVLGLALARGVRVLIGGWLSLLWGGTVLVIVVLLWGNWALHGLVSSQVLEIFVSGHLVVDNL
jgi:hypothetical protein